MAAPNADIAKVSPRNDRTFPEEIIARFQIVLASFAVIDYFMLIRFRHTALDVVVMRFLSGASANHAHRRECRAPGDDRE